MKRVCGLTPVAQVALVFALVAGALGCEAKIKTPTGTDPKIGYPETTAKPDPALLKKSGEKK